MKSYERTTNSQIKFRKKLGKIGNKILTELKKNLKIPTKREKKFGKISETMERFCFVISVTDLMAAP
jgi:hypothetical protein